MYIVLCGPPATRKGAAIKFATKLLREHTKVKFAPNDTGGQRQGLIAAMVGAGEEKEEDAELMSALADIDTETLGGLANGRKMNGHNSGGLLDRLESIQIDTRDPRTMYIAAGELNSILGENNTAMLTFLQEMWDGVPYEYKLRATTYNIADGLLGIIGGTTSSQISLSMPPEAIGQGFTSRIIFVHADRATSRIPRPTLEPKAEKEIGELFASVFNRFDGPFEESPEAAAAFDRIYMRGIALNDTRFLHYAERRGTAHLPKVAMALAAGRGSLVISEEDITLADQLLSHTEASMPEALGEYGMNKLGAAKQRLLDYVKHTVDPIPMTALYGLMSRDMSQMDFKNVIAELHNARKITKTILPGIGECVMATDDSGARAARRELSALTALMTKQ